MTIRGFASKYKQLTKLNTSRVLSERSSTWANSPVTDCCFCIYYFIYLFQFDKINEFFVFKVPVVYWLSRPPHTQKVSSSSFAKNKVIILQICP